MRDGAGRSPETFRNSVIRLVSVGWSGSAAVLEAPAVVAGLDDVAMVREPVEQSGGHLRIAEHGGPFAEGEVGGDDDRSAFIRRLMR